MLKKFSKNIVIETAVLIVGCHKITPNNIKKNIRAKKLTP